MATDIQQLLARAQEVINTGVKTVKETRITQDILQKNIEVTDKKIGIHNVDEEAHPDIRERIEDIPILLGDPLITGPDAVENALEYSWTLFADLSGTSYTLANFIVTLPDGSFEYLTPNEGNSAVFTHTFYGKDGDHTSFGVKARASNAFTSTTVTKNLVITQHEPPVMDEMVWNFPDAINPGTTQNWSISGITDDDTITDISISCNNELVTISKTSGLNQNDTYTITTDSSLRGQTGTVIFTVVVTDSYGYTSSRNLPVTINRPPVTNAINLDINGHLNSSTTETLRVSGVTDPDGGDVTYTVTSSIPQITFSKGSGIAMNEEININVGSVAAGTKYTLTFTFVDRHGGETTYTHSSTINTNPNLTKLTCGIPNYIIPGKSYQFAISGGTDDEGGTLAYTLSLSNNSIGTLSKSTGVANDEVVILNTNKTYCNSNRGISFDLNITATDANNGSSATSFSRKINRLPVITNAPYPVQNTGGTIVDMHLRPGTTYKAVVSDVSDADSSGQTLTYTLTCDEPSISISKTGINTWTFVTPGTGTLPRGSEFTVTATVSDGYESVSKSWDYAINRLPDISGATVDVVDHLTAGDSITTSVQGITNQDTDDVTITISSNNPDVVISPSVVGPGDDFTINISPDATPGDGYTITYTVSDDSGETQTFTTVGTINRLPVLTNMELSLPEYLIPGKQYSCAFSGITDPDNENLTIDITNNPSFITLSKKTGIAVGESITATVSSSATRGATVSFSIRVTDESNGVSTDTITRLINRLPVIDGVNNPLAIGTSLAPDQVYTGTISGATDADGQSLTYSAVSSNPDIVTSVSGTRLTVTTPAESVVPRGTEFTVTLTASDGYETDSKTFSYRINELIDISDASIQVPNHLNPGDTISTAIEGVINPDSDVINITMSSNNSGITFSPSTVTPGQSFDIITSASATPGSSYTLTFTLHDSAEETKTITVSGTINYVPNVNEAAFNLPAYLIPGNTYSCAFTGITDQDNEAVTINITNTPAFLTFSKKTGIAVGENIQVTVAENATRGNTTTINFSAVDPNNGTSTGSFSSRINRLPVLTNVNNPLSIGTLLAPNQTYNGTIRGATDADNQTLTYSATCSNGNIDVSVSGTTLTVKTPATSVVARGTSFTVTLRASDGYETVTKKFTYQINRLPSISAADIELPAHLVPGSTISTAITGITNQDSDSVTISLSSNNPSISFSPTTVAPGESFNIVTASNATQGARYTLTFTVKDSVGETQTITRTSTIDHLPDVSNLEISLPEYLIPGKEYNYSYSGIDDADGEALTVQITNTPSYITFGTKSMASTASTTATVSSSAVRGNTVTFNIKVTDASGGVSTATVTRKINRLPNVRSAAISLPAHLVPGTTLSRSITGVTDPDGNDLTLTLSSNNADITFSPATVTVGQSFNIIVADDATQGAKYTLTFKATDSVGESASFTRASTIDRLPNVTNMDISLPEFLIPGKQYSYSYTGISDADNETMTAQVTNNPSFCTFATKSMASTASTTVTISSSATRGSTVTFNIKITDASGGASTKTITRKINRLPVVTSIVNPISIGTILKPSTTYSGTIAAATDADGQNLTYSATCNNADVNVSMSGRSLTIKTPSANDLARGSTFTVTISVSDGLETATKALTYRINRLPVVTSITNPFSIGTILKPSTTYTGTIAAASDADSQTLTYSATTNNEDVTVSVSTRTITLKTPAVSALARGSSFTVTITVSDGLETASKTFTYKINRLPVVTGITNPIKVGTILKPSTTYSGTIAAATDSDSQTLTYSATCNNSNVDVSLNTNRVLSIITPATSAVARGTSFNVTITVSDGIESATRTLTYQINRVPANTITCSVPSTMKGGTANKVTGTISGATDADGHDVEYRITNISSGITVTPTTVAPGGTITVTATKVSANASKSFKITAYDEMGEAGSTLTKTITVKPILYTSAPKITSPTNGQMIEFEYDASVMFTAKISAYATSVDLS